MFGFDVHGLCDAGENFLSGSCPERLRLAQERIVLVHADCRRGHRKFEGIFKLYRVPHVFLQWNTRLGPWRSVASVWIRIFGDEPLHHSFKIQQFVAQGNHQGFIYFQRMPARGQIVDVIIVCWNFWRCGWVPAVIHGSHGHLRLHCDITCHIVRVTGRASCKRRKKLRPWGLCVRRGCNIFELDGRETANQEEFRIFDIGQFIAHHGCHLQMSLAAVR